MAEAMFGAEADVRRDSGTGAPRKVRGSFLMPSGAAALLDADSEAGVAARAREFLHAHAEELAMPQNSGIELSQERRTPNRRVLRFQEFIAGVPVFNGAITVQIGRDNRIKQIDFERLKAIQSLAADAGAADAPALTADEAMQAALDALGNPQLRLKPSEPRKVYFPADEGFRLAYEMLLPTRDPHDWRVVVDARDRRILYQRDLIKRVEGRGFVFDPNPVVTARNPALRDPAAVSVICGFAGSDRAIVDAQRVARPLRDLTLRDGKHRLDGPYVTITNFGSPASEILGEADPLAFNYSSEDPRFEAVNIYYHVDAIQRYIQSLGIVNVNNRPIPCDPHDNTIEAAWYSPADRGLHFSDSGACRPDRAEDAECILHEYGHAIQDDQVPGWGEPSPVTMRDETAAMGEGFGDVLACVYFAADHPFQEPIFEDWIFGDRPTGGLRRLDGKKIYPDDWENQPHADGEIWASALWEIFQLIGGASPDVDVRRVARDELLKPLILSHFMVPANGTMPDGAQAFLEAYEELPEYGNRNVTSMRDVFRRRGILESVGGLVADLASSR